MTVLELQAEEILKKMTEDEVKKAAKVGIMFGLALTKKAVKTVKNYIEEISKNGIQK